MAVCISKCPPDIRSSFWVVRPFNTPTRKISLGNVRRCREVGQRVRVEVKNLELGFASCERRLRDRNTSRSDYSDCGTIGTDGYRRD